MMPRRVKIVFLAGLAVAGLSLSPFAFAHEAYVLPPDVFQSAIQSPPSGDAFAALLDAHNRAVFFEITLGVLLAMLAMFFLRHSRWGMRADAALKRRSDIGIFLIRMALAASLLGSAVTSSIFGPELPLSAMPFGYLLRIALYILSALFFLGLFTEAAAAVSLVIFLLAFRSFGWYVATYLNYFGEIVALLLFGSRFWSLDKIIFGSLRRFAGFSSYEPTIVRCCYGVALGYAAVTVKFLHPILTVDVVNIYHLNRFAIFPSDPLLVTLGAALAELLIGILIFVGFETRITVFISLIYITLSLWYFKEVVWPHLMLYGISLSLLLNDGGKASLNGWIDAKLRKRGS